MNWVEEEVVREWIPVVCSCRGSRKMINEKCTSAQPDFMSSAGASWILYCWANPPSEPTGQGTSIFKFIADTSSDHFLRLGMKATFLGWTLG